jgi:hypothetical protein
MAWPSLGHRRSAISRTHFILHTPTLDATAKMPFHCPHDERRYDDTTRLISLAVGSLTLLDRLKSSHSARGIPLHAFAPQ